MKIDLLFEQSGTSKRSLREMGNDAKDIDISNAYNETDIFDILDSYISNENGDNVKIIIEYEPK